MKRSKFLEEQIVYGLRQVESGTPIGDLCRQYWIAEQTFYFWGEVCPPRQSYRL